jgi:cellulose synthase/poly-beta-1,6-N-acetylglucosamine synthase-like glycosyltransferase
MTRVWLIVFWVDLVWLLYAYIGYAICLRILGFFRECHSEWRGDYLPKVSVLISARNEEKDIERKVRETLNWNYPPQQLELLVASDASDDRTDEILRSIHEPRLKYKRMEHRVGKNEALNRLFPLAAGDLLFFTDANSRIDPDCLRLMTRHFADHRVGCVTGYERTLPEGKKAVVGTGWRAFLAIESRITLLESRLGSVLTCDGSIFCIRRQLYTAVVPELANDLEIPIRIGSQGWRLLYEPAATSLEREIGNIREDFDRRRRICSQGSLGVLRLRKFLRGLRLWQFVSRKVLRWLTLIPLVGLLISTACLASHPVFAFNLGLQLLFYGFALVGWLLASKRRGAAGLFTFPFYWLLVNTAAMTGLIDTCLGRRFSVWEIAKLSRGQEQVERTVS